MKTVDEMTYTVTTTRDGRFVGKVAEFPQVKTRKCKSRLDALDQIVQLTAEHLQDICAAIAPSTAVEISGDR